MWQDRSHDCAHKIELVLKVVVTFAAVG